MSLLAGAAIAGELLDFSDVKGLSRTSARRAGSGLRSGRRTASAHARGAALDFYFIIHVRA